MFIENNQSFVCVVCGKEVMKHQTSSRNHCNWCLTSLHVDNNPGDRSNPCEGIMDPIGLELKSGKNQIIFKCRHCKYIGKNVIADDDNQEMLIELARMN